MLQNQQNSREQQPNFAIAPKIIPRELCRAINCDDFVQPLRKLFFYFILRALCRVLQQDSVVCFACCAIKLQLKFFVAKSENTFCVTGSRIFQVQDYHSRPLSSEKTLLKIGRCVIRPPTYQTRRCSEAMHEGVKDERRDECQEYTDVDEGHCLQTHGQSNASMKQTYHWAL